MPADATMLTKSPHSARAILVQKQVGPEQRGFTSFGPAGSRQKVSVIRAMVLGGSVALCRARVLMSSGGVLNVSTRASIGIAHGGDKRR